MPIAISIGGPVQDYAKSALNVASFNMSTAGGNLLLARDLLERVANSNSEEVAKASMLLKECESRLQAIMEVHQQNKAMEESLGEKREESAAAEMAQSSRQRVSTQ